MIEVDEKPLPWSENMTMASLLETLENVEFCSVVRLNGKLISSPKFAETNIPDNSKIQLLPLVAGG
ncbi:MAG: sulfur carrier protein ThiS [Desulfobacula sp.]|nr:sulfur carrier protein ThiS [Desulfobacula sp.]